MKRTPFEGVINIIRFNWHFYVIAGCLITVLFFISEYIPAAWYPLVMILFGAAVAGILLSLIVSWYVYDLSGLYTLKWLSKWPVTHGMRIVNIHAGFDETSKILGSRYPEASLTVLDFYDPAKHTEVSIERARRAYAPYPGTIVIDTEHVPLTADHADLIYLLFAAHEIRNNEERIAFFRQLGNALRSNGKIIVTEHLRDPANFMAYNLGFFHFHAAGTWKQTFDGAGLEVEETFKITPFITTFILRKNGSTS